MLQGHFTQSQQSVRNLTVGLKTIAQPATTSWGHQ